MKTLLTSIIDACREADGKGFFPPLDNVLVRCAEEHGEVAKEIRRRNEGKRPGKDGLTGECVDNIATLCHAIYVDNPSITAEELEQKLIKIVTPKLKKWHKQLPTQIEGLKNAAKFSCTRQVGRKVPKVGSRTRNKKR